MAVSLEELNKMRAESETARADSVQATSREKDWKSMYESEVKKNKKVLEKLQEINSESTKKILTKIDNIEMPSSISKLDSKKADEIIKKIEDLENQISKMPKNENGIVAELKQKNAELERILNDKVDLKSAYKNSYLATYHYVSAILLTVLFLLKNNVVEQFDNIKTWITHIDKFAPATPHFIKGKIFNNIWSYGIPIIVLIIIIALLIWIIYKVYENEYKYQDNPIKEIIRIDVINCYSITLIACMVVPEALKINYIILLLIVISLSFIIVNKLKK